MIPPMNPQLAYIFKSQIFDKMPNVAERDVASIAKKWVGTAARPGRFLRESSLFFLSRESGGVKGQMLLPPGATSLERAQMGEKGLQTENRPVIIPEYDYPGLPFEKLADFVATQAVLALRAEREGSRLGPDLSQLIPAQPLTEVNSLDESGAIDTELIESQREMYMGYSQRVIDYLWNRLKNPFSVAHLDDKIPNFYTSLRHLGYSSANGRTGSWEANGGIKVGIMGDKPDTVVQMKIKPLRLKNRTAYQFEVRESIEQVKKNLEAEGYAVLSMFTGADYLMHVTKGKTTPLTSAEVYQDLVESGCKMVGNISSKKGVWAAKDLKYQSIKFTKESFIGDSKLPFVFPLSLHIMPPSTKSSKTNPNEGSNFFSPTESSGYVILPFDASVPIKEGYDNHPQVVDYRAAEIMPMIQSFYATAGILEPLVSPSISLIEETTSTQSADYLMTVRRNLPRSLELEEVEGAEIVQVWNDGVECALAAGELSLPGGVTLTNLPQTYEASVLAPKDVVSGVLVGETKESIFGLIEESRDIIDEAHNFELLTRWGELTFLAHTSPNQQIVGKLMGNTVRPARYGTAKSASEIHYDEVIRGNADGLMALFEDGTRGIAYAAQTIDTAVIAFDIEGKRAKNGEIGNVLLGVLSNERRALELETGKITRKEEIFSPVATLGSWVGFSVEARRNMIEHLSEHITHIEDGMAFVNPYSANVIVRVEHKGITDPTDKPVYRLYQREVPFEGPKFPGKSSGDPKLRLLQFGGKPDSIDAGAAVLKLHDERLVPNIRGGKIIGLVSIVSGLEDMVGAEVKKVSPEYSRTGKGAESRFLTGIPYAQIKINQPRPRRRQEPFNPFAVQTMSKADKYRDEVALLQNQIPAEPNHKFNCGVCSYCTANPNKTSHWHEDHRNGRIYSSHFLLRLGERAMPGNAARGNYVEYINGNITLDEYMKAANRVARVSAFPKNAPKVPKYELVNSKVRPSFAYNKFRSYFNNPRPAEIEINPVYYDSGISYSPFRSESFSNLVLDNPMSPMIARGSALMSFIFHEAGDVLAAQLYKDEAAAKADKTRFLKACKANLEEKYGPIELQTIARTNVCLKKGGKVGNIHNCGSPYLSTQVKQTRSADEGETTFIHCNLCLGKDEEKGRNNPPKRIRGSNFIVHGDYIEAKSSMVNTGDGTQVGNQTPGRFSNSQMNIHGGVSTENIEEQDPYEELTNHVDKFLENPPPKVMITVPHASMDSDSNWIEHCTDWSAVPFAIDIRDKLSAKGATTTLLLSDTPRQIVDFNRIAAAETDFHKYLDKNIDSYDLLLDIHSFPDHYPAWKGYDIVLFTNDDEMPEHCVEDVLDLADHLGSHGLKVLVDQADTRNYIQIKASQLGLRSHLIEVNENLGTDAIAELIAEYFAFDTRPIRPVLDNPSKTPKGRKIPKKYLKGLNKEEMMIAAREIDKGYKYDIDDPEAYEEWKSDIKAKARGYKTVPSKYKKKFVKMYGPLPEKGDFITKISKATGIKKSILKEVEKKGLAAWRTGHRVGANQHAWARGRVYSFVTVGNTVKKGNKKMGDYQLAVEAGLIKNNPRDYEEEYRKYGSSKESIEYRSELNKYNREQGTYGNNDGLDASHIDGEIVGFEDESINRGRREKSRLKKDNKRSNPPRKPTVSFSKSPRKEKKMVAVFTYNDGRTKTTHFGAKGMSDYTIHKDPERKKRYITRHRKRENWDDYTSAGSLSRYILWGEPTLRASKDAYLKRFNLKEVKSNPPEGITIMSAILRFDLPRIVPLTVAVELLEDVGFVLDRWGEGYKGGGFATLLVPKSITKENVRIKIQQNSKMVMLFSGHKITDNQQKKIRQLVFDAYEMKRNPAPAPPKNVRRLSTELSKTLMGDLIPFNYKDAIRKEKEAEKKRAEAEKKRKQASKKKDPKKDDKQQGNQKKEQKPKTNPPPPKQGMTRLWRGDLANKYPLVSRGPEPKQENTKDSWGRWAQWSYGGRYFTTNKQYALQYANDPGEGTPGAKKKGNKTLMYIDIPTEVLNKYRYDRIYNGPMKEQHAKLGSPNNLKMSSLWRMGKVKPEEIPYPFYDHSYATPGDDVAAKQEYWIGPDIELYGKVKLDSAWIDNPPVFAKPERISGKPGGAFITESGVDVTGRHYKGAIISAGLKRIDVDGEQEVPKPEPRSKFGRRIKFNMLRPKTFDIIDGDIEKGTWLITAETSEGHIYVKDDIVVKPALTLKAFPNKKSEPRLRPETYGGLSTSTECGRIRIKSSGKEHIVWCHAVVGSRTDEYKQNPTHAPIALSKKKTLQSKMQKHNAMQKSPIRQATNGAVEEAYRRGGMNRVNRFFKMLVAKNPPDDAILEDADLMPEGHPVKNKAESLKRQSKSSGIVKPTVEMFKQAFGFPSEGGKFAGYVVEDFDCRRIMVHRNREYKFEWSIVLTPGKKSKAKIEREMKKFSTKKEMLPSPKRLSYEVTAANEYTIDRLESDRVVISGHGRAFRIKTNPIGELDSDGEMYINDHKPMSAKKQSSHYKREKLKGKVGSDAFMYQLAEKCQTFGEGSGYVKDGYLYYRKGSPFKNEVRVDGTMIEGATAFYHTHPAAWEPSQTSPEDFMVYHGMFTNLGMTDFFTVFGDRIDWFTFPKGEKFQPGEMAEIIEDFENDIEAVFNTSQDDFQDKMGDKPYLVPEQTRYINKMLCQCIPEYFAKYRCYELAPKSILEAAKINPPIETTQYHTEHLEKLDEIKPVKLAHDGNASEAWIGKKRYALSELIAARAARMVHRNNPRDQIDRRSKDWAVMERNDMKDGMSWREARKFAKIAARRPHPAKEYTERMVVLHPDEFVGNGSTSARYYGEHDKMQMLKSYGLNDNAVKAIREYLANYTGKTSHFHILQMLNLYRNVSKIGDTDEIIDDICNIKQTDGVYSIHMDGLSCEILKKLVKDRQDLSKLENMEKSKKRHGEHFIALALHTMYHAMLSPLDSPSSAFSGMEQNDYLSTIAQNLNRTLQTAEAIAV